MMKVIELREAITAALKSVHPRVYYEVAHDKEQFPFLVVNLPDAIDDGTLEQFVLDVDGWDAPSNGDTTALEMMMDAVDKILHRMIVTVDDELAMMFYRDNRLVLTDDDPRIRRRKYIYQVRTFERRS